MTLFLYNTLTREKQEFKPLDADNVRMYVCGPTVYDRAHLGNARSVVVYDVLYRLLCHIYGTDHVTYARNITDVDDKINAAAKERRISIQKLTEEVTGWFHEDMGALNVLPAVNGSNSKGVMLEPKATHHIAEMIAMIEKLIKNDHAYVAEGNVLFSVASAPKASPAAASNPPPAGGGIKGGGKWYYGMLSGRIQDDLEAGARVKVEGYKRDPGDFVLWKPADAEDDPSSVFDSPWGKGRPGWHIECSAMSTKYLGETFDIHGGGADLMFPHHENEIAQSIGANPGSHFARYWVHNGFLTVRGEKMSKSLGNFITVRDLLDKGVKGEVIRLALLSTKYSEPLNWNDKLAHDAKTTLDAAYRALLRVNEISVQDNADEEKVAKFEPTQAVQNILFNDLNTPLAISVISEYAGMINNWLDIDQNKAAVKIIAGRFRKSMQLLGILQEDPQQWFKGAASDADAAIQSQIDARVAAKKSKNWAEADRIRNELKAQGILLEDKPDGTTDWRRE